MRFVPRPSRTPAPKKAVVHVLPQGVPIVRIVVDLELQPTLKDEGSHPPYGVPVGESPRYIRLREPCKAGRDKGLDVRPQDRNVGRRVVPVLRGILRPVPLENLADPLFPRGILGLIGFDDAEPLLNFRSGSELSKTLTPEKPSRQRGRA